MIPNGVRGLACALALAVVCTAAQAGETVATPVCGSCRACRRPCYDPCEPVGPIRRFLRKVFLPRCPAPCPPPCPVPVVVPAPGPTVFVPPAAPPTLPPAGLERPVPVAPTVPPPAAPFPSATSRWNDEAAPPPPVRVDRIASLKGER
jgi:hypothetical protein